MGPAQ